MATTGLTTNFNLSYPIGADSVSLAADLQEMAEDIDTALAIMLPTTGGTMTGTLSGSNTTDASSPTTGAFKTAGGMGVAKKLYVGTDLSVAGTFTLGANTITLAGNLATSGAYNLTATLTGATNVTFPTTGTLSTLAGSETLSNKTLTAAGTISSDSTTNATSTTTGSIQTDGGIGVAQDVYVGGSVVATNVKGRNHIHNGSFNVWQRGSTLDASSAYKADRWYGYRSAAGTDGYVRQYATGSVAAPAQGMMLQRVSGTTGTTFISAWQVLESVNSRPLANKTVTLSYWAMHGTDYSATNKRIYVTVGTGTGADQASNTIGSWTGNATPIATYQTIDTTWTRYTHTATLASAANQIYVRFDTDPFVGTAGANDYVHITGVQLEEGSVATPYEFKDYGQDLRECQRYYYRIGGSAYTPIGEGLYLTASEVDIIIVHPQKMRTAAAFGTSNGTNHFYAQSAGGGTDYFNTWSSGFLSGNGSSNGIYVNSGVSGTAGQACHVVCYDAAAYIDFSADL